MSRAGGQASARRNGPKARLARSTLVIAGLATIALASTPSSAYAARYWTIRPAPESGAPLLWLGTTPGSGINAASLSTPTAGNHGQHWTMRGGNLTTKPLSFINRQTGQCLDLQNTPGPPRDKNNLPVVLASWTRNGCYITATWGLFLNGRGPLSFPATLKGTYTLVNASSSKCLGVPYFQYRVGTQLQQYTCTGSPKQRWLITGFED